MATHSSNLAWRIPWTEESGGLWSIELQRVRYNLATKPPSPIPERLAGPEERKSLESQAGDLWSCVGKLHVPGMREAERQGQRRKHGQGRVQVSVSTPKSIANFWF